METWIGIKTLIKRFFFGTPQSEVKYNNPETMKMENKYLRYMLKESKRETKKLELKIKLLILKTV